MPPARILPASAPSTASGMLAIPSTAALVPLRSSILPLLAEPPLPLPISPHSPAHSPPLCSPRRHTCESPLLPAPRRLTPPPSLRLLPSLPSAARARPPVSVHLPARSLPHCTPRRTLQHCVPS